MTVRRIDAGYDLDLLCCAVEAVARAKTATSTLIQRRARVGFAKASRLLDLLEEAGVVGPWSSGGRHEVLITEDQVPAVLATLRGETR